MFTNKPVRNGVKTRPQDKREYHDDFAETIQPFNEPDTQAAEVRVKSSYMAELEAWLDAEVFSPIEIAVEDGDAKELHLAFNTGKLLIKRKVLSSFHNGLKAKERK